MAPVAPVAPVVLVVLVVPVAPVAPVVLVVLVVPVVAQVQRRVESPWDSEYWIRPSLGLWEAQCSGWVQLQLDTTSSRRNRPRVPSWRSLAQVMRPSICQWQSYRD